MTLAAGSRVVLALGSVDDPTRQAGVVEGRHPDVEYREMVRSGRAELFDVASALRSPAARIAGRLLGNAWASAVTSFSVHRGRRFSIIASGEDVGLPMALVHGLHRRPARPALAIICHGSYLRSPKLRVLMRILRNRAEVRFLCLSSSIARHFVERLGVPADRVDVVGYGVDTEFFRPDAAADAVVDPCLIASAGMASRDYRTLVEAVRGLDVRVVIAADSEWFPTTLDIADEPLPRGVNARSFGDYVSLRRLYAEAAVVVVPLYDTLHAAGYAVIIEAMAMGKPVIATATSGRSDLIVDGETGFYVSPGDPVGLRSRIEDVLDHPEQARAVGERARQHVEAELALPRYVERILAAAGR